ncbi:MAG TPA: hypothetical protein VF939_25550 [Puia sp.]
MRKLALIIIVILMATATGLKAQSLQNTSWKVYIDALHDTITLHIGKDSSFVTDSGGDVVVRSVCKVKKDTLSLRDYEGKYFCPDGEGVYKVAVTADALSFTLVNDPCEGRNSSISGTKWIRVTDKH